MSLGLADGEGAEVEDRGSQHGAGVAVANSGHEIVERANAAGGDHRHRNGIGDSAGEGEVETGPGAVAVHGGDQQFAGAARNRADGELDGVEAGRLAAAMDVPLGWFFAHEDVPEEERGFVVRGANRRVLGNTDGGLTEELLSPDLGNAFEVILSSFEPGAGPSAPQQRATQEVGYLVSGRLRLWIGEACFNLAAGDSFRLQGETFRWHNPGTESASVVWVIAPPIY